MLSPADNERKNATMTGIRGINTQDFALQEGMGLVVDRSREHFGTTDRAIIVLRQVLKEALDAVERGETPHAVDPATYHNVRSFDRTIANDADWRAATRADLTTKY